ncbi:MAG: sulfurtransferase-like selenium metabolism protein YedF [Actinomycetota bacterium]|nr:sulfurtransferase-like selenium metabolism protein YedF [Actinomycetota bacterium]
MAKEIDARGLPCPRPVILTKQAIEEGVGELVILVDNEPASENVSKMARKMGYEVKVEKAGSDFRILAARTEAAEVCGEAVERETTIFINSDTIGRGDDELGAALMKSFLYALTKSEDKPNKVIFMNGGVKLVVGGSEVVDSLKELIDSGVHVLACGTCLDFFKLKDKVAVGEVSNMYEILSSFLEADKVITI